MDLGLSLFDEDEPTQTQEMDLTIVQEDTSLVFDSEEEVEEEEDDDDEDYTPHARTKGKGKRARPPMGAAVTKKLRVAGQAAKTPKGHKVLTPQTPAVTNTFPFGEGKTPAVNNQVTAKAKNKHRGKRRWVYLRTIHTCGFVPTESCLFSLRSLLIMKANQ